MYFAAFGVRAIPNARDKRVLLLVRVVLDTYSFQRMLTDKSFAPGASWLNKIHTPVSSLAAMSVTWSATCQS